MRHLGKLIWIKFLSTRKFYFVYPTFLRTTYIPKALNYLDTTSRHQIHKILRRHRTLIVISRYQNLLNSEISFITPQSTISSNVNLSWRSVWQTKNSEDMYFLIDSSREIVLTLVRFRTSNKTLGAAVANTFSLITVPQLCATLWVVFVFRVWLPVPVPVLSTHYYLMFPEVYLNPYSSGSASPIVGT